MKANDRYPSQYSIYYLTQHFEKCDSRHIILKKTRYDFFFVNMYKNIIKTCILFHIIYRYFANEWIGVLVNRLKSNQSRFRDIGKLLLNFKKAQFPTHHEIV